MGDAGGARRGLTAQLGLGRPAEHGGFVFFVPVSDEYGRPVHYSAVERGTPVYDSEGTLVGAVRQVADNYREHILDGFVIDDEGGTVRFVDAPEVERTFERAVTLNIDAAAVAELGPPDRGAGVFGANLSSGRLSKMFGSAWRKK